MVMGAVVAFRDAAGKVDEVELAAASPEALVAGRPWRVLRWHQGQRHYSGWYWSATTGNHVVYESRLELARLLLADFDPLVVAIAAQPFRITADVEGRRRWHVPDFLLLDRFGAARVVNVKPADRLGEAKVAEALGWAAEVFDRRGWVHEVWSGASAVVLANIRFLSGFRHRGRVDADAVRFVERSFGAAVEVKGLEAGWPGRPGDVRAAVLHLLWRGVLVTDLSRPLSGSSVLERVA